MKMLFLKKKISHDAVPPHALLLFSRHYLATLINARNRASDFVWFSFTMASCISWHFAARLTKPPSLAYPFLPSLSDWHPVVFSSSTICCQTTLRSRDWGLQLPFSFSVQNIPYNIEFLIIIVSCLFSWALPQNWLHQIQQLTQPYHLSCL